MDLHSWDAINVYISLLNVFITAALTLLIILQTKKLNKQQNKFDLEMNEKQIVMQKNQLKVDTFPYKREIYLNLKRILTFTSFITENFVTLSFDDRNFNDIYGLFETMSDTLLEDTQKLSTSLSESQYMLPNNISSTVIDINRAYDQVCTQFLVFKGLGSMLTTEEQNERKSEMINNIRIDCEFINSKSNFINSIFPKELSIGDISR